jgi:hypothetical protein
MWWQKSVVCDSYTKLFGFFWEKMAPRHHIVKKKKSEFAIYRLQVPVGRQI